MTLTFVVGLLMGLAWGAVERHWLRRDLAEARRERDDAVQELAGLRERYAVSWQAAAVALSKRHRPEPDWRDVDTDAQEGD